MGYDGTSGPRHLRQLLGTPSPPSLSASASIGPPNGRSSIPWNRKLCPKVSSAFPRVRTTEHRRSHSGTAASRQNAARLRQRCRLPSLPLQSVHPSVRLHLLPSLPPSLVHVAQINNFFPPLLPLFLFGNDVVWPRPPSRPPPPLCVA